MFETSKDVLNLLLGFSILWVALWFSWILYQIGRTLKGVNDTINIVKNITILLDGVSQPRPNFSLNTNICLPKKNL